MLDKIRQDLDIAVMEMVDSLEAPVSLCEGEKRLYGPTSRATTFRQLKELWEWEDEVGGLPVIEVGLEKGTKSIGTGFPTFAELTAGWQKK